MEQNLVPIVNGTKIVPFTKGTKLLFHLHMEQNVRSVYKWNENFVPFICGIKFCSNCNWNNFRTIYKWNERFVPFTNETNIDGSFYKWNKNIWFHLDMKQKFLVPLRNDTKTLVLFIRISQ